MLKCPKHTDNNVVGILEDTLELFCTDDLMEVSQSKKTFCSIEQLLKVLTTEIRESHLELNASAQKLEVSRRQEAIIKTFHDFAKAQVHAQH